MARSKPTEQRLTYLHQRFVADETLNTEPALLSPSETNGKAVSHALRLSAYHYPNAYGAGYRALPAAQIGRQAIVLESRVYGMGIGRLLTAGLLLHVPLNITPDDDRIPSIAYIFRLPEQAHANSGKALLKRAFEHLVEVQAGQVGLQVSARNGTARSLYESLGFVPGRSSSGATGHKIIQMMLPNRVAIANANEKLKAQL